MGSRINWLAVVLLTLLPPALLWPSFALWGASALEDDLLYYLPQRWLTGQLLADGHWPLWNPLVGLGFPLAGDPQSAVLYPATWLFAVCPPWIAYPLGVCLHFTLAGLGFYAFARAVGTMRPAALIGAVAFQFCGFLVGHRVHLTMLESAAWLPWMLLAAEKLAQACHPPRGAHPADLPVAAVDPRPSARRWIGLYGLFAALQLLAGHAQVAFYANLFAAAWLLVMSRQRLRALACLVVAGLLAGLLAAPQLLATLQLIGQCARGAAPYSQMVENSFLPAYVLLWVAPWVCGTRTPGFYPQQWWGHWHWCEMIGYVGLLTLPVAAWAAWWFARRDRVVGFATVGGAVALVLACGDYTPVYRLVWQVMHHLPLVGGFRCPARLLLLVNFAFALLLARGLHHLWLDGDPRLAPSLRRWIRRGCVLMAATVGGLLAAAWVVLSWPGFAAAIGANPLDLAPIRDGLLGAIRVGNPAIWVPAVLLIATVIVAGRVVRGGMGPHRWGWLLGLLIVDLATVAFFADMSTGRRLARGSQFFAEPLGVELAAAPAPAPGAARLPPRLFNLITGAYSDPLATLTPNTNQFYGVQTVTTYGPLQRRVERRVWNTALWAVPQDVRRIALHTELLARLGVQYVVSDTPDVQPAPFLLSADDLAPAAAEWSKLDRCRLGAAEPYRVVAVPPAPAGDTSLLLVEARHVHGLARGRLTLIWQRAEGERPLYLFVEPDELAAVVRRVFRVPSAPGPADGVLALRADDGAEVELGTRLAPESAVATPASVAAAAAGRPTVPASAGVLPLTTPRAWRIEQTYPRAYVAATVRPARDALSAADHLVLGVGGVRPASAPASAANVPDAVPPVRDWLASGVADTPVAIELYDPNRVVVRVGAAAGTPGPRRSLLVLNDAWDPGWRARVDGRAAEVHTVNALVRGVWVDSGGAIVEFTYRPLGWPWALALAAAGGLIVAALVLGRARR